MSLMQSTTWTAPHPGLHHIGHGALIPMHNHALSTAQTYDGDDPCQIGC